MKQGEQDIVKPVKLVSDKKIFRVFLGKDYVIAISENNQLVAMGNANDGQIGAGDQQTGYKDSFVDLNMKLFTDSKNNKENTSKEMTVSEKLRTATFQPKNSKKTPKKKTSSFGEVKILSITCCSSYCVALINSKVFIWGKINSDELSGTFWEPHQISELESIQIKQIVCSNNIIYANPGLQNKEEIIYKSFEPPVVECGSQKALVKHLFSQSCTEDFMEIFFVTYPTFSSEYEILKIIKNHYEENRSESERKYSSLKIIERILKLRTESYDPWKQNKLFSFTREIIYLITEDNKALSSKMLRLLIKEFPPLETPLVTSGDIIIKIFTSTPLIIAQQISLATHTLFKQINPFEFLSQKWNKPHKLLLAPGIIRMISSFNNLASWLTTVICSANDQNDRSFRSNFFVEVLMECINLRNFFSSTWIWVNLIF